MKHCSLGYCSPSNEVLFNTAARQWGRHLHKTSPDLVLGIIWMLEQVEGEGKEELAWFSWFMLTFMYKIHVYVIQEAGFIQNPFCAFPHSSTTESNAWSKSMSLFRKHNRTMLTRSSLFVCDLHTLLGTVLSWMQYIMLHLIEEHTSTKLRHHWETPTGIPLGIPPPP